MRAVVLNKPGDAEVVDVDDPTPAAGQVVIAVDQCGICGTDLHIYDGEFAPTPYPIVPGHEFAGRVVATGEGVRSFPEDRLVAVDPSLYCGHCSPCRRGRANLCANWDATGDTVDGAFAEYVAVPADTVYVVGEETTASEAAMIEPLSCAVHALDRLDIRPGDEALLYGAGTMGLLFGQLLRLAGCERVDLVDTNADRLPRGDALFATNSATRADEFDRDGWDLVVDATGAVPAIEDGLGRVRGGGTFMVFGVTDSAATASFSPFSVYNQEITITGSMGVLHSFGRARDLVASGAVEVASLVTDVRSIDEYTDAIADVRAGKGLKTQLSPTL